MKFDSILFLGTPINTGKHGFKKNKFSPSAKGHGSIEFACAKYASNFRLSVLKDQQLRKSPSAAGGYHLNHPCESVPIRVRINKNGFA